ncbi:MAG: hypothetical protein AAF316_04440 [Cyanobacteria bacterium P01_A01_bin.80]
MYNTIADIDQEIAALEEDKAYLALYWFETGEADRDFDLSPQYSDNDWYMMGWNDRDYQQEIGFNPELPRFEHF